jgi:hypothetical protein
MVPSRTSPTNIGMGLLANLAACDLGYLTPSAMLQRTVRALLNLLHLEQYHGHFYNWYDTSTLQPAEPRYISTVDSGNLWAALLVLHAGTGEMRNRPLAPTRLIDGVRDTLAVIASLSGPLLRSPLGLTFAVRFAAFQATCERAAVDQAIDACRTMSALRRSAMEMGAAIPSDYPELKEWARAMTRQCAAAHREVCQLAFWRHLPGSRSGQRCGLDQLVGSLPPGWQRSTLASIDASIDNIERNCTLAQLPAAATKVADDTERLLWTSLSTADSNVPLPRKLERALTRIARAARRAAASASAELQQIRRVQDLCRQFCAMDFRFLYDDQRKLLSIGYNVSQNRRDEGCYDLLASEARMTSFLAVSHGQLPLEHWFALGRIVTLASGKPILVSWSGSMFEHLMPSLIMPSYRGTFLEASCRAAVQWQMRYAQRLGIPWGISESSYHAYNEDDAYGYRAFGVPGLGLERELGKNLVVAPYASALALAVAPRQAMENLADLERIGCLSSYGFYDAIDYTPGRDLNGRPAPCRIVMAHHSGMTLVSFANVLVGRLMERRFFSDGLCQAHDLLLQERLPKGIRPVDPEKIDVTAPSPETRAKLRAGRTHGGRPSEPSLSARKASWTSDYGPAVTDRESPAPLSGTE